MDQKYIFYGLAAFAGYHLYCHFTSPTVAAPQAKTHSLTAHMADLTERCSKGDSQACVALQNLTGTQGGYSVNSRP